MAYLGLGPANSAVVSSGTANSFTINPSMAGSLTAATTVTATTGNITASAGNIVATLGSVSAATTVTGGTGITATTGNIVATAGQVNAGTSMTAATDITATAGNIAASAGSVSAATTVTAGTGITSTTGNIVATAGEVNAGTTMTAGTGITSTTGNIVSTAGQVNAGTTMTAGTGITATTGNIVATVGDLTAGGSINIPVTSAFNVGVINQAAANILHSFGSAASNENIFVGHLSANNFTLTGTGNSALGANTFQGLTSGSKNSAVGLFSQQVVTSGNANCSLGALTLLSATTAASNIAIGTDGISSNAALINLLTGTNNIAIGTTAGNAYTGAESSNIIIGNVTGTVGESNKIRIGAAGAGAGQQNACFIAGIFGVTVGGTGIPAVVDNAGQLGTVVSSRRLKENIKEVKDTPILNLRPVTFNYISDESKTKSYGLIAEEVQDIFPDLVIYDDKKQPFAVKYHELPVILLNEIKKLNKRISDLEKKA